MQKRKIAKTKNGPKFDPALYFGASAKGRSIATHRQKQVIYAQGGAADAVFYIKKGKVKMTVVSKQGKEAVIAILGVDEFFGEGCLIGQPKRLATASAMTDCEIMRVEMVEILRVLEDEPAFSQMFVSHILARSARVEADLVAVQFDRKASRQDSASAGQFRQGGASGADHR